MGYNSLLFICNDVRSEIDKDPAAWWERARASLQGYDGDLPSSFGFGRSANGFQAVWNQHADLTAMVLVGGNHATVVGSTCNQGRHHDEEDMVAACKAILEKRGYTIRKRPKRRA